MKIASVLMIIIIAIFMLPGASNFQIIKTEELPDRASKFFIVAQQL